MANHFHELEREARVNGEDPNLQVRLVRAEMHAGADIDIFAIVERLSQLSRDVSHRVLALLGLSEDERVRMQVMVLMNRQIDHALRSAVQPREGDAPLPDRNAILRSIEATLTADQARILLDTDEVTMPTLVLVPVTSAERTREELTSASQTMKGSQEPYISDFAQGHLNTQAEEAQVEGNKIKSWRFAILEGAQTFKRQAWDDAELTFRQRRANFRARLPQGMSAPDFPTYSALMRQGLLQGKPIDCKYKEDSREQGATTNIWQYTLLNETDSDEDEGNESGLVGAGYWSVNSREVRLDENYLQHENEDARFRFAVMGDIVL